MNAFRTLRASTRWTGTATMALLLASSSMLMAQNERPKSEHRSPPARSGRSSSGGEHQGGGHQAPPAATRQPSVQNQVSGQSERIVRPRTQNPEVHQAPPAEHNSATQGRQFGRQNPENSGRQVNPNINRGSQPGNPNSGTQGRQFGNRGGQQNPQPNVQPGGQNSGFGRPAGQVNANPSGTRTGQPMSGYRGPAVVRTPGGGEIHRGAGGFVREVRTPNGAVIHHAPEGSRRVEVVRPGGRVVVASAHGYGGYVQRPLVVNNVTYVQRTYVVRGVSYARVYRPWVWGGVTFHVYTPVRYYRPAFYGYVWTPWARPVYYRWGWLDRPWYGYYGGYFAPYPYYTSPALWLTDYLIATTLEEAYQERMAAAAQANYGYSGGQVALTPDVKQSIADEVHRQLEQERAEQGSMGRDAAGNAPPPMFSDNGSHVFVVSTPLQANDGGMGCALTEGDVLRMDAPPPRNSTVGEVVVLASKGRDCRKGSRLQIPLDDLQEMQNQMRATIDQGLNDLQSRQGQDGLPRLPSGVEGTTNAAFAHEVRPDANVATEISQAAREGDRAEQDVLSQADNAATASISLGMTIAEVEQAFGRPKEIADLGAKKVYVYNNLKVIFVDGRVSDVQ